MEGRLIRECLVAVTRRGREIRLKEEREVVGNRMTRKGEE